MMQFSNLFMVWASYNIGAALTEIMWPAYQHNCVIYLKIHNNTWFAQ